jgi:hypothetical protein
VPAAVTVTPDGIHVEEDVHGKPNPVVGSSPPDGLRRSATLREFGSDSALAR